MDTLVGPHKIFECMAGSLNFECGVYEENSEQQVGNIALLRGSGLIRWTYLSCFKRSTMSVVWTVFLVGKEKKNIISRYKMLLTLLDFL